MGFDAHGNGMERTFRTKVVVGGDKVDENVGGSGILAKVTNALEDPTEVFASAILSIVGCGT